MLRALKIVFSGVLILLGFTTYASSTQTLVIDNGHLMVGKENTEDKLYHIKPTEHLLIDYSQYRFLSGKNGVKIKPDTMSVIIDNKRQYFYKITDNKTVQHLYSKTLTYRDGFQEFSGLKSGDKFILAIGNLVQSKDNKIFKVAWIGVVKVSN
ncbi:hypothetical protein MNBD_GAMMA12-1111 [hydrothermal vent metagenome]|uniref:Uncharacterized protein n=1 Tax=hydrothermal vent metagenome TaxID=652676 RepID=A0A3B0Y857_9ZZZZ